MMTVNEIRQKYLDFFQSKAHKIVPAAPIVNKNDPTLMFINSGMAQFKDFFLGNQPPSAPRIADTQKCLRVSGKHNDLEDVGRDGYHLTMFEMLGNWSFGDYFKKEAIQWSWELLTEVYKIPKDRIYVTVFGGDEKDGVPADADSAQIWKQFVADNRIKYCGKKDNFWEMGDTGPCGPCTEIHVDVRSDEDRAKVDGASLVNEDHPQVIEIWNNVFMEFERRADGSLVKLPKQHVDTGMGLERLCMVLQGKTASYDTDVFQPYIQFLEQESGKKYTGSYAPEANSDIAMRVIADHIRAVSLVIGDGQMPSNTGAGYVVRRVLRRAVRYYFSFLGIQEPLLHRLVPIVAERFDGVFPEVRAQQDFIATVIKSEEESFLRTLSNGLRRLEEVLQPNSILDGRVAFELYDTYGFPLDLTNLIANEKKASVDTAGFEAALNEQKERSRKDAEKELSDWVELAEQSEVEFLGYEHLEAKARVLKYRKVKAKNKEEYQIVLDRTPFYAEGGGQVGDMGQLFFGQEAIEVLDTKKENNLIIHWVKQLPIVLRTMEYLRDQSIVLDDVKKNSFIFYDVNRYINSHLGANLKKLYGEDLNSFFKMYFLQFKTYTGNMPYLQDDQIYVVQAKVNARKRHLTENNHSATHLLHAALRQVLGGHVQQKGSLVNEEYLRFDFAHHQKMSAEEIQQVEAIVNQKIRKNISLQEERSLPIEEARQKGAMMLFGEKYGETVRMITFDDAYSKELCGGCHVRSTGQIGFFKIVEETSIAAGIRRVTAYTAEAAEQYVQQSLGLLAQVKEQLKNPKDLVKAVTDLQDQQKALQKQVEKLILQQAAQLKLELAAQKQALGKVEFIGGLVDLASKEATKQICHELNEQYPQAVVVLGANDQGKASLTVAIPKGLVEAYGLNANQLIKAVAAEIQGGGGGQAFFATAGGTRLEGLSAAVEQIKAKLAAV